MRNRRRCGIAARSDPSSPSQNALGFIDPGAFLYSDSAVWTLLLLRSRFGEQVEPITVCPNTCARFWVP